MTNQNFAKKSKFLQKTDYISPKNKAAPPEMIFLLKMQGT
jgi:hypothetical protein